MVRLPSIPTRIQATDCWMASWTLPELAISRSIWERARRTSCTRDRAATTSAQSLAFTAVSSRARVTGIRSCRWRISRRVRSTSAWGKGIRSAQRLFARQPHPPSKHRRALVLRSLRPHPHPIPLGLHFGPEEVLAVRLAEGTTIHRVAHGHHEQGDEDMLIPDHRKKPLILTTPRPYGNATASSVSNLGRCVLQISKTARNISCCAFLGLACIAELDVSALAGFLKSSDLFSH